MTPLFGLFSLVGLANAAPPSELPLKDTRVDVLITGPYAEVTVTQVFSNPNEDFIHALYSFPLHQDAAVDAMTMAVGDRVIQGEIHTREEAREIYEEAKDAGHTAALTEQERPNLFTQSLANLQPGEDVIVTLHLVQPLTYNEGVWSFEHPMTVGPRFTPAGSISAEDQAAISPPIALEPTGTTVDVSVYVEMGTPLYGLSSPSHPELRLGQHIHDHYADFDLNDLAPTRDLVIEIDPVGSEPVASLLVQGDHFALTLEPMPEPGDEQVVPRELIFVVDNSCSMSGTPMNMAKDAMRTALQGMLPGDTFQVIRFSEEASALGARPLPATPENIERGMAYVDAMEGMGGTHMLAGIEASLDFPQDPDRQRIVAFMTDGYIGNETEILGAIEDKLGPTRLFSFGIGSSVNRYLLDEMSEIGGGTVTYVLLNEDPAGKVEDFYSTIARPVLTEIEIDYGPEATVWGDRPEVIRDLYVGHPLQIVGRFDGELGPITVSGRMGDRRYSETIDLVPVDDGTGIASAWARGTVADLERQQLHGEIPEVKDEITDLALEYSILTRYTSFVAVEYERVRNPGGEGYTLQQPSEAPDGVDVEAAVGGDLSRTYMPPGDPLLTIEAPADADQVVAVFPWGDVAELEWDATRSRWYHRFLVPRDVDDGEHVVRVFIMLPDGSTEIWSESLFIDSEAPELDATAEWVDGTTVIRFRPEEPLRHLMVVPDGDWDAATRIDLRAYEGEEVVVVLPGEFDELTLVVKDRALNRIEQTVVVTP